MFTFQYIVTVNPTFPVRGQLKAAGCKWDGERKQWYADTADAARTGAMLCGGHVQEVTRDTLPPKPKPRGRPFRRGADPRRATEGAQPAGNGHKSQAPTDTYRDYIPPGQPDATDDEDDSQDDATPAQPASNNGHAVPPQSKDDAASQFAALIRQMAAGAVDAATVQRIVADQLRAERAGYEKLVADAIAKVPAREIVVRLERAEPRTSKVEGTVHKALPSVLERINLGFHNLFLVGPSGSGKTTLAKQVADALGLAFGSVSCSAGMSEGTLLGRLLPTGEAGRFEYSAAPFVTLYETGGVFLLDEVDAADPNTLLVLNSATANGHLDVPNRLANPVATRHPNFVLLCAGNTWGTGATREYVGRNQLDAAFLSRFSGATFHMEYDTELERALVTALLPEQADAWLRRAWDVRAQLQASSMRRVWGTRELLAGAKLLHGCTMSDALEWLTLGWSMDDKQKAGIV